MSLWRANILITKNDVFQRGIFRFFWANVGTAAIALICLAIKIFVSQSNPHIWWAVLISFAGSIIFTAIGVFLDSRELDKKWKEISGR